MPFITKLNTPEITSAFIGGWTWAGDGAETEPRVGVMFIILFISLFAVSFPGISKQVAFLQIPHILFFIGKHFGTGVILATAFIHLLGDAYDSLQKPVVKEQYHNIGRWTGLLILMSFLGIFLIEYVSTTYVDHLHSEPSAPPSPERTPPSSRPRSRIRSPGPRSGLRSPPTTALVDPSTVPVITISSESSPPSNASNAENTILQVAPVTEHTPLLPPPFNRSAASAPISTRPNRTQSLSQLPRHHHHHHNTVHAHLPPSAALIPIDILTNSPRLIRAGQEICKCGADDGSEGKKWSRERGRSGAPGGDEDEEIRGSPRERHVQPRVGRRRQVVGILVLQLGIMIHSFVIGLTLAITRGADFTSLTTAIIFHQLFEGLSLGIRIAALPALSPETPPRSLPALPVSPKYLGSPRSWPSNRLHTLWKEFNWLKFTLSVLFAITTPLGMGIGLALFPNSGSGSNEELARMYLTQGLMSAISAGMLIYASAVEMIAGDFVFGDVEGHTHGHGHGHSGDSLEIQSDSHSHSPSPAHEEQRNGGVEDDMEEAAEEEDREDSHGKIRKKVLAVASLLAGVGGMVLVGLAE